MNQQLVAESRLADWLPDLKVDGASVGHVGCADVLAPGVLTVTSFNAGERFTLDGSAAVLATGDLVCSSADNLYVATTQSQPDHPTGNRTGTDPDRSRAQPESGTQIHQFNITGGIGYVASGSVRGQRLNQFTMSEHHGVLRVASTDPGAWGDTGAGESFVTVLRRSGTTLQQVGVVGNLGRGEDIHAVRFLGDTGNVVTFGETDPLYVGLRLTP